METTFRIILYGQSINYLVTSDSYLGLISFLHGDDTNENIVHLKEGKPEWFKTNLAVPTLRLGGYGHINPERYLEVISNLNDEFLQNILPGIVDYKQHPERTLNAIQKSWNTIEELFTNGGFVSHAGEVLSFEDSFKDLSHATRPILARSGFFITRGARLGMGFTITPKSVGLNFANGDNLSPPFDHVAVALKKLVETNYENGLTPGLLSPNAAVKSYVGQMIVDGKNLSMSEPDLRVSILRQ